MQETSELYKQIVSEEDHGFETVLSIGDDGRLITQSGETITFGGVAILVDTGGPETAFREDVLWDVNTTRRAFTNDIPEAGGALSGEINVKMLKPVAEIPKKARLAPYIRAVSGDGAQVSEWLQKGVFYVDTRKETHDDDGLDLITIHGYDGMLLFEQNYPSDSTHDYPMLDVDMVNFIASSAGIAVDQRTYDIMIHGYMLPLPVGYSQREVLGIIAACYGGNFVISDQGELLLITIGGIPKETNYLIDQTGDSLVFGADLHYEATESGGVVTFDSPAEITALSIDVEPVQAGSGDPSPDNVRPFSGWDSVNIWNKPTHDTTADPTVTIQLGQTVYGRTLDVTGGTMTVDRRYIVADGVNIRASGGYGAGGPKWLPCIVLGSANKSVNDSSTATIRASYLRTTGGFQNAENSIGVGNGGAVIILHIGTMQGTDGTHGYNSASELWNAVNAYLQEHPLQICYKLATPIEIPLTPTQIATFAGQNNVWSDAGDVTVTYKVETEAVRILV